MRNSNQFAHFIQVFQLGNQWVCIFMQYDPIMILRILFFLFESVDFWRTFTISLYPFNWNPNSKTIHIARSLFLLLTLSTTNNDVPKEWAFRYWEQKNLHTFHLSHFTILHNQTTLQTTFTNRKLIISWITCTDVHLLGHSHSQSKIIWSDYFFWGPWLSKFSLIKRKYLFPRKYFATCKNCIRALKRNESSNFSIIVTVTGN